MLPQQPIDTPDHLLPEHTAKASGPLVGTGIIVALLLVGALYFWGAVLNRRSIPSQLPFISGDPTSAPSNTKSYN